MSQGRRGVRHGDGRFHIQRTSGRSCSCVDACFRVESRGWSEARPACCTGTLYRHAVPTGSTDVLYRCTVPTRYMDMLRADAGYRQQTRVISPNAASGIFALYPESDCSSKLAGCCEGPPHLCLPAGTTSTPPPPLPLRSAQQIIGGLRLVHCPLQTASQVRK